MSSGRSRRGPGDSVKLGGSGCVSLSGVVEAHGIELLLCSLSLPVTVLCLGPPPLPLLPLPVPLPHLFNL